VVGWNRSAGTREKAHAEGLTIADDLGDVGSTCAVVLTMLPDLPDVVPVLDGGLLSDASAVRTLVVMGTVSPVAVRALADARPDLRIVDAPVSAERAARAPPPCRSWWAETPSTCRRSRLSSRRWALP
jgi:3-hydroxyisobutyrate dehydrogenase-like beta-hydroxyacid dehydrogenase